MRKNNFLKLILIIFCLSSAGDVIAKSKRKKRRSKTQVLNFQDDLIKGGSQRPELFYLLERKEYNFKKLIRLRKNFLPEMRSTAEDIHQTGSGD